MKLLTRLRELRNMDSGENADASSQFKKFAAPSNMEALALYQRNAGFYNAQLDAEYMGVGAVTVSDIKRINAEFN